MLKRIGTGMGWSDYVDTETGQEFVMDWDRRDGNEPGVLIPLRRAQAKDRIGFADKRSWTARRPPGR